MAEQSENSMFPNVAISSLEKAVGNLMKSHPNVNLGEGGRSSVEQKLNELLGRIQANAEGAFLLTWEGNKIPRGAEINGKKIAWTQNGVVTAEDGSIIGTYERITEWGGESKKEQSMVVFVNK